MATLLDGIEERHDGPEPKVVTTDVQRILKAYVKPENDDAGESVTLVAENAGVSTRTVYRVLNPKADEKTGEIPPIALSLADRLCLAANGHVSNCRLQYPDGTITSYH